MSQQTMIPNKQDAAREAARDEANRQQKIASDPRASVFVSASAGSGKTKLLIDRLLRLMLPMEVEDEHGQPCLVEGSDPSRILCLTYTKAAAAEMAHRLQNHLGRWVSLSDEDLGQALRDLDVPNTEQTREKARGLFLKVLDAPGGLQVETIHAFCQSLLRRFPLEAALDPHFTLLEETDGAVALRRALDEGLAQSEESVRTLAGIISFDKVIELLVGMNAHSDRVQPLLQLWQQRPQVVERAYQTLLQAGEKAASFIEEEACSFIDEEGLRADIKAAFGLLTKASQQNIFQPLLDYLARSISERHLADVVSIFLTNEGAARKMGRLVGKKANQEYPSLLERMEKEADRQVQLQEKLKAQRLLEANMALLALALPVIVRFAQEKKRRGVVDYNDLIAHTRDVLREPGAAWVLYKLDGGIDHLLLDEVQDTSALQWEIAGALTVDFFSGEGAREKTPRPRTIFAVGDFKQSIYSFQGAEPEQFHKWRREFANRVTRANLLWRDPDLNVSFRSVPPILAFVDSVFENDDAAYGLRETEQTPLLKHVSARSGEGGRIELWPLVPAEGAKQNEGAEQAEEGDILPDPWRAPQRNTDQRSAQQCLADGIAQYLSEHIGKPLQAGKEPLKAGDVLVLVPKRSSFLRLLIRALKTQDIPVASFIRDGLTEQAAVQDLMTLCDAVLLPQDDLSLASVLTSPLGGVSDQSLMDLATYNGRKRALGRGGQPLWSLLRERHTEREDWRAAWERLQALYRRVDYDTPYSILMQALGVQGGRTRLLARLGPEAAEPIDELLTVALAYEAQHPPSLQGFLQWLRASAVTSRREAENDIDAVRIMTVHSSKGLQSRLVIMPDTTSSDKGADNMFWPHQDDAGENVTSDLLSKDVPLPLWVPLADLSTSHVNSFKNIEAKRLRAEKNRLLYVGLTRASDALIICGWQPKQTSEGRWYHYCREGLERLKKSEDYAPYVTAPPCDLGWEGEQLVLDVPVEKITTKTKDALTSEAAVALPTWLGSAPDWQVEPAPQEDALARPLAPSRPDGAIFGPLPAARSPLDIMKEGILLPEPVNRRHDAMQRGVLVHRLLQFLPDIEPVHRHEKAQAWLKHAMPGLVQEDVTSLAQSVVSILEMETLAPLFGPGSRAEQGISGTLGRPGDGKGRVVLGQVDRFCFDGDVVWLCDYKTGRPPRQQQNVPRAYIAQMSSYRQVMQALYPGRDVRCFIVWIDGPKVTELSEALMASVEV